MITKIIFTKEFDSNYKKLTRKNRPFEEKVKKKIEKIVDDPEIIVDDPEIGVSKRYNLKGVRGVHINPFVITYVIIGDAIVFITINHHDFVYGETSTIYARLMDRCPQLWSKTPTKGGK